ERVGADDSSAYASTGGVVTNAGIQYMAEGGPVGRVLPFRPRGIDTQPVMAAVGEGFVNRRGMRWLRVDGLNDINSGKGLSGGLSVSIGNIQVGEDLSAGEAGDRIGKLIAREIRKKGRRIA